MTLDWLLTARDEIRGYFLGEVKKLFENPFLKFENLIEKINK